MDEYLPTSVAIAKNIHMSHAVPKSALMGFHARYNLSCWSVLVVYDIEKFVGAHGGIVPHARQTQNE